MFFGAQPGLDGVNGDQVRVEQMFFGAQPGLVGVKSGLSSCFFDVQPGLSKCDREFTVAKSGLSICFSVLNPDLMV